METTPEMRQAATFERHQRQTRREIILPAVIGLAVLVIAVLASAFISTRYEQLSLISNFVLTLLILCPAALCMFPIAMALVIGAVGMNRVHDWSAVKLDTVNSLSYKLNRRIDSVMGRLGKAGVDIGAAAAPLEQKVFSAFDRPNGATVYEVKHEPSSKRSAESSGQGSRGTELES